jgi:hypothetical protein
MARSCHSRSGRRSDRYGEDVMTLRELARSAWFCGGPSSYSFQSWSDGGAQTHNLTAPATATTYTATYRQAPAGCPSGQHLASYFANRTLTGTPATVRCETTIDNNRGSGSPPTTGFGSIWTAR